MLLLHSKAAIGQNTKKDSLIAELKKTAIDTVKIDILLSICEELTETDASEGEAYGKQALSLSRKIDYLKGVAEANFYLAYYELNKEEFEESAKKFLRALSIYKNLNSPKDEIFIYYGLGTVLEYKKDFDSALLVYEQAFYLSDSIKDDKLKAHSNYYLGGTYHQMGNNEVALKYTLKSHEYYEANGLLDDDWYALNDLGIIHDEMGLYAEALNYNLKALEIAQYLENKQSEIIISNNIAVLYNTLENNAEAINYYESAFETSKVIDDKDMESTLLGNIAALKAEEGDTATAFSYTRKALKIQIENEYMCELPYSYEGLGDLYIGKGMLDSAIYYLKKAEQIGEKCNDFSIQTSVFRNLGIAFKKQKKFRQAEEYLIKSLELSQKMLYRIEEKEVALELYKLHKQLKNNKEALRFHELFQETNDAIFNLGNAEKINRVTAEYEFRKEKKLIELQNEKELLRREAEISNQTQIRNGALMGLFISIVFLIVVYQSYVYIKLQNRKLTLLNNEKNTLMGIVAHDLRNPLNNIKTIVPLMKEDTPEVKESMGEFVDMIGETANRMYEMIDRILDESAIEEMKLKLNKNVVDLGQIVIGICDNFKLPANQKNIELIYDIEKDQHFSKVDENYLLQIIENLISNAIKFSSENDTINISINTSNAQEEIVIEDNGPGITLEEQNRLFGRYEKLSNKPTAGEPTTGLGLYIVKRYTEAMGGTILCESTPGEGAKFVVSFESQG